MVRDQWGDSKNAITDWDMCMKYSKEYSSDHIFYMSRAEAKRK